VVNVKLLKKVRKLIAEDPRRLNMEYWGIRVKDMYFKPLNPPPCGTIACLAGWTILAATPEEEWPSLFHGWTGLCWVDRSGQNIADKAAALLGFKNRHALPFGEVMWGADEVIAWIDRQLAEARTNSSPKI